MDGRRFNGIVLLSEPRGFRKGRIEMHTQEEIKIHQVASDAICVFWNEVAKAYPEITEGDLSVGSVVAFDVFARDIIEEWVETNRAERKA